MVVSAIYTGQYQFLNNNAVSSDIARMTDIDNLQDDIDSFVKEVSVTVDFGYAKQAILTRVGNTVFCKTAGGNGKPAVGAWFDTRIRCPQGYRPSHATAITGILPGGAGACVWIQTIAPGNVNMQMMVCGDANNSSNDYQGIGVWHTNDAWPA